MSKEKRATWFKCFLSSKYVIDAVPDEEAGRGLKAAFQYFATGEIEELSPLQNIVFAAMKPYIDEAIADYEKSVQAGKQGAENRWGKE